MCHERLLTWLADPIIALFWFAGSIVVLSQARHAANAFFACKSFEGILRKIALECDVLLGHIACGVPFIGERGSDGSKLLTTGKPGAPNET